MTAAAGPRPGAATPDASRLGIVIVIARYPPHHLGGYELRCRDISRELVRRGHRVTVLTSREGRKGVEDDGGVRVVRALRLWPDGVPPGRLSVLRFVLSTSRDAARLRREVRRARADVVAYWHQAGLSSALLALPRPKGCGVLCDVSSDWLEDSALTGGNWFRIWEKPAGTAWKRAAKAVLRPLVGCLLRVPVTRPPFPPGRAYFTSEDRRRRTLEAGVDVASAALIRSGIDLERFPFDERRDWTGEVRLLFLGRMKRRKGLHTVALALGDLPPRVRLRAVGPVEDPAYLAEVGELAAAKRSTDRIEIRDAVPHSEVSALLRSSHVLVFASEEPEAFSRLVLESFASGTLVVGTTLGGTGEVLFDGETGLAFAPGNSRQLSNQLLRLLGDADLRARIVRSARTLVETKYALGFTVGQIETLLASASAIAKAPPPDDDDGAARGRVRR